MKQKNNIEQSRGKLKQSVKNSFDQAIIDLGFKTKERKIQDALNKFQVKLYHFELKSVD